ncbi:MAG: sulfatase [Planctomycetes bacterium]|nr:sulfatase [Planctomycetota bacterium]
MNRRKFLKVSGASLIGPVLWSGCWHRQASSNSGTLHERPNLVIILTDNMGYGDLGCYGSKVNLTPQVDKMASEGMRFTSFYSSSGVCTPSRASLMTGCYAQRVDMHVSDKNGWVLRPVAAKGLNPSEVTIAEMLRQQGYATICIGKWHLGDQPEFLPTRQGFDSFYGIPYSEDMYPRPNRNWPPLPLLRNEQVVEAPADLASTTGCYVTEAIKFMKNNRRRPFFLYFPHHLPGSMRKPVVDARFSGKSANGPWGDSIEEIDWSVGEILQTIKELNIDKRTLVLLVSDNGAPLGRGGSNEPMGGSGYTTSEGGMRVPCIIRWPGTIPSNRICDEVCTMMDILPTFTHLAGGTLSLDRIIDGRDAWALWSGQPGAKSPSEVIYYYMVDQLQAVRCGQWKLHLDLNSKAGSNEGRNQKRPMRLINLSQDLQEKHDVSAQHPDIVKRLLIWADKAREDLGDTGRKGSGQRKAGWVRDPTPRELIN